MQTTNSANGKGLKVSMVTVNFNAGPTLKECIASAIDQVDEIIIVDNGSTDDSIAGSNGQTNKENHVHIIQNNRNLGFAAACNIGANAATSSYLLFLNPDCQLAPDSIAQLCNVLEMKSDVGMAGGLLLNPDGSEQGGGRRNVPTPWRTFVRAFGLYKFQGLCPSVFKDFYLHTQPLPDHPIEVEAISGACMLVKLKAMEDVGLWDEGYFLHCEDLDWCMRFRQRGWKVMFVPSARVYHVAGQCSQGRPIFVEWHKHKGMIRFYRKFFQHQYPGLLMGLVTLGVWFRFGIVASWKLIKRVQRA